MKFKRKKPEQSPSARQRRQPVESETRPVSSSYSYRTSRSEQLDNTGRDPSKDPSQSKEPKRVGQFLLQRFGLIILLIAVIVSLVNVATLQSNVNVQSLSGQGTNTFLHDSSDYKAAADKLMASSRFNTNKITVNSAKIEAEMLKKFPELSNVTMTLPLLSKRPVLYIETSPPALILNTSQGSYLVDDHGKALMLKDNVPGVADLKIPEINDQSGIKVTSSRHVLTSDSVSFVKTVVGQLKAKQFIVSTMTLPAAASELDVTLVGQPYTVKFNLRSNDARQQAGTFLATIAKLQSQSITPAQYVDVRVDGRAYYQ